MAAEDHLAAWKKLSDSGDANAQIVMAWEYAKGKIVEKDLDRAIGLFRAAEPTKGRLARFNLAKVMIINRDPSFENVIRQDCEVGFDPALYLMGTVETRGIFRERNIEEAVRYFSLAAKNNHLPSEFFAWRLQKKRDTSLDRHFAILCLP